MISPMTAPWMPGAGSSIFSTSEAVGSVGVLVVDSSAGAGVLFSVLGDSFSLQALKVRGRMSKGMRFIFFMVGDGDVWFGGCQGGKGGLNLNVLTANEREWTRISWK